MNVADEAISERPLLRRALIATFRKVMRLYFRDVERLGEPPGAGTRGRVFVSNHFNALIDPILVITDAACDISPIAKSTLWSIPGLAWLLDRAGAVPIVRRKDAPGKAAATNDAMFERIAEHLAGGGNILIFPEGTSHSEPKLAPLRTGAARMLAAGAARGANATFQAVGLEFDARDDFRSRCLVLWGPVRAFADVPGASDEERVQNATAIMDSDLRELLVEGDTHDERRLVTRVAELFANDAGDDTLRGWNAIGRQVELAARTLRAADAAIVDRVRERVDAYYAELERVGVKDARIATPGRAEPAVARSGLRRVWLAPLALSGVVLYAIPYVIPRFVARNTDLDAKSTVKLGAALVVYPVWAAGLVGVSLLLPPPLSLAAAAVALASPFAALEWLDARWARDAHRASAADLARLVALRAAARAAIDDARAHLV